MSLILDLIIFFISYSIISIIFTLILLGLFMGTFFLIKIAFNMNEEKWDNLLKYKNNIVLIFIITICLIVALTIIYFISNLYFEIISFKYKRFSSEIIIICLVLPIIFKFFKLKDYVKCKIINNSNKKNLFE